MTIHHPYDLLERMPEGYRHLAYLKVKQGWTVKMDMPQLRGPEVEGLYAQGRAWLAGASSPFSDDRSTERTDGG